MTEFRAAVIVGLGSVSFELSFSAKNCSVFRFQARLLTGKLLRTDVGITLSVNGEPKRFPQGSKRSITRLD